MVDIEPGQLYASENEDGSTHHILVLDVDSDVWTSARAMIYVFEMNETFDVHARTLWRMCERLM
jgi:hypothetical protein